MNLKQATAKAIFYSQQRKEIRKLLITEARRLFPFAGINSETRKLHHFPSDLSEDRLLKLIGQGEMAEASNGPIALG